MINDPEAEDKLDYYDKVAEFELDYQPITAQQIEFKDDEADDQEFDKDGDDQDKNNINESRIKLCENNNKSIYEDHKENKEQNDDNRIN